MSVSEIDTFKAIHLQFSLTPQLWKMYSTGLCCFRPKKNGTDEAIYCDSHRKTPATASVRESDNTMDLFDLIARTQNSRIDDQRCELPGVIQVRRQLEAISICLIYKSSFYNLIDWASMAEPQIFIFLFAS